jgi:hypothetical protein
MADLDELLSEGLISQRALDRLNNLYGVQPPPIEPGSQDASTMTHWPPEPNTARPFIDAINAYANGGMVGLAKQQGYQTPEWADRVTDFLRNPAVNDALGVITPMRTPIPIRRFGIPAAADPPISSYRDTNVLDTHPDYAAAKAGDPEAADRFVSDTVKPETIEEAFRRFGPDATYVPVHAEEAAGRNAIPSALAFHYADQTGANLADSIVQTSRAFHTGAPAIERIFARPQFHGPVEPGPHVLVDDVSVMGSTLAELANHIQANGGDVAGVVNLVNASRLSHNVPLLERIRKVEQRHGQAIQDELGIAPGALTAAEAEYLLNFGTSDALRNRIAKGRLARQDRLLSRGIRPSQGE